MNFSEADELLQLAAARQQVSMNAFHLLLVRVLDIIHGSSIQLRVYTSLLR